MDQEKNKDKQPIGINQKGERLSAPANTAGSGDSRQAKINLPVGGGAIRGIGEKFQANPVTGTASFSVPLTISEGRGKFTPQLALSYDSGSGNSVFGLGWNVAVPSITRKTDKGLPKYDDNPANESDTFILSGAEDLVPVVNSIGVRISREEGNYIIYTYQPRTEGLFALIERWVNKTTHISHWRSISKENITSVYGLHESTRIYDPDNTLKIFSWLLEESWDAKGNLMRFAYKREDGAGVSSSCYEKPRLAKAEFANTYLKSVFYGNNTMCSPSGCESNYNGDFHFTLVFDYGDYSASNPQPTWTAREDAFSNNKAGFEIRTYRLCRRVLMFHTFTELGSQPVLVRSTDFEFELTAMFSLLQGVTHKSYQGVNSASFPPLTFNYTQAMIADTFKEVPEEMLRQLPAGVDGQNYQWADLYSEGVSGILSMNNQSWYFMPNYGDKQYLDDEADSTPVFGGMHSEVPKPAAVQQRKASFRLNDIDSDGYPELVIQGEGINGFYSRDEDGKWLDFRSFASYPNINFNNANLRFMDLTGDGSADILISKGEQFDIYFSEGKKGYGHYKRVRCSEGEGNAPKLVFSDPRQRIFLADMDGDGLTDIVRISNQSIVYWANRGYGIFSDAVVMSNPPLLDSLEAFDSRFVHLVDVDGTGTADLLYISNGAIRYFQNRSGNAWAEITLPTTIRSVFSKQHYIQTSDLLGNGTQCVVFTTSLPDKAKCMRYWELTSGIKPFLLKEINNNMGGLTRLCYAPSTKFYMQDKLKGRPWITKLPFPVHVLEKVETIDLVGEKCFTNRYAYHHGYYDSVEREFRGFGMVEQWDTESPTQPPQRGGEQSPPLGDLGGCDYVPPVYTKTWFHTGFFKNRERISRQYEREYYRGDTAAWQLPDTILPDGLTGEEAREACRSLKGSPLRIEIYALDGTEKESIPYTVEEKSYQLQCLQHRRTGEHAGSPQHAIFLKTEGETLAYHYERQEADPRIAHKIVLETDPFGNELKSVQIAYPRRAHAEALAEQLQMHIVYTENSFINETLDMRMLGVNYQNKIYEITGISNNNQKFEKESLLTAIVNAVEINYTATPGTTPEKRKTEHQRIYFWNDSLTQALPLGEITAQALPYQQQNLELTQDIIDEFNSEGTKITTTMLQNDGKYLQDDSNWWIVSEIQSFDASAFYLPVSVTDPFGNVTSLIYDEYHLMIEQITDALLYETLVFNDYRVLQAWKITDPNGNSQSVAFDALGMVKALAVSGKNSGEGDNLTDPTIKYEYNLLNWRDNQKPVYSHIESRETHGDPNSRWLESYTYSGGLGQEVQTKVQAEDGLAWTIIDGEPTQVETTDRWTSTGRTILNNKGKAVKQYEPWFSTTHEYEPESELTEYGVTPIFHYDPLVRNIKTDFPDGTFAKVEFTPWEQKSYDQNDNVLASQWYADRSPSGSAGDEDKRAALITEPHNNTPQTVYFDSMGRAFITEDDNGTFGKYRVKNRLDISGRLLEVTDAKERVMTKHFYGFKQLLYTQNIDSGKRWMLCNVAGKPIQSWDERGHAFRNTYDVLQRPLERFVTKNSIEKLVQKQEYGISVALNNIGQIENIYTQDGKTNFQAYDFKNNVLSLKKQFAEDYQNTIDWSDTVTLQTEEFVTQTSYDALNRPITITQPDNTVVSHIYNKGGLLEQVQHGITAYISNINYNEKGQRTDIYYGNSSKTKYEYDNKTFRVKRILTTRNTGIDILQNIYYFYDPIGNITEMRDDAQQTHYFNNTVILPTGTYIYDPLYRLIAATGRELTSLAAPSHNDFQNDIAVPNPASNAMQTYNHSYTYDELGNILTDNWKDYVYDDVTNRLLKHDPDQTLDDYTYDVHGNITSMPHLSSMVWDYKDELVSAGNGTFTSYYNYDAQGERSRKVVVKGNIREERYYVGNFEIYRKFNNTTLEYERKIINIADNEKVFVRIETKTGESAIIRYQYDNHLGSTCLELDISGAIISYEEYHPFGTTSYRSGRTETEVSLKRYKYCGKERDEETGLYYYGMRYYAAWLFRFVSVDPLQFKYPELTPFQYASNNPISMIDLDGKEGVMISQNLKRNYPELYKAAMIVIQSEQGKELLKDFATKKQAKQYWGIKEKGVHYSRKVKINFSTEGETEGGRVITKINKQDVRDIQETLEEKQSNNENLISTEILKKTIDKNVKMDISILSGTSGLVTDTLPGLVENYAHELFIHASYDLEFLKNVLSNPDFDANNQLIKELSGDIFGQDTMLSGTLTTLFQHYLHFIGENTLYESFSKEYKTTLSKEVQGIYQKEIEEGREASKDDAKLYMDKLNIIENE